MGDHDTPDDGRTDNSIGRRPFLKASGLIPAAAVGSYSLGSVEEVTAHMDGTSWYGAPEPDGLSEPHEPTVIVGDDYFVPADIPPDEKRFSELGGETIREDLETIIDFSKQSRQRGVRRWGRIAGRQALTDTINWTADQYRNAGVPQVEVQSFASKATTWRPIDWEVKLLGNDIHGEGSGDVILGSAHPVNGSPTLSSGGATAPLVYIGTASPAELHHIDVSGKVAVQHLSNQGAPFYVRNRGTQGILEAVDQGAVGVLNVIESPGNMHVQIFEGTDEAPSFNLGGQDGSFLEFVMDAAAEAGNLNDLEVQMKLQTERRDDLSAENAVGIIPGKKNPDENIIVNAHADAWFDGASDNGDGLAVQIALAKHFAQQRNRLDRTLVFVATAGHHTTGLDGPEEFVRMNPGITDETILVLNIEHIAQKDLTPSYEGPTGEIFQGGVFNGHGFRRLEATTMSQPSSFGIHNSAPFLIDLAAEGTEKYRLNISEAADTVASGEAFGYLDVDAPRVGPVRSGPLYHTSGDVLDTITTPGLERIAQFYRFFLEGVDQADTEQLYN